MKRITLKSFLPFALLSGIAAPYAAPAGEAPETAGDTITSTLPAAQREAIASTALRALRSITQARNAIHDEDPDQALKDVQQARELLALIEATRPASSAVSRTARASSALICLPIPLSM